MKPLPGFVRSTQTHKCWKCGNIGTGFYKAMEQGKYICPECLEKRVLTKISTSSAKAVWI